jgi:hypothetical protein
MRLNSRAPVRHGDVLEIPKKIYSTPFSYKEPNVVHKDGVVSISQGTRDTTIH